MFLITKTMYLEKWENPPPLNNQDIPQNKCVKGGAHLSLAVIKRLLSSEYNDCTKHGSRILWAGRRTNGQADGANNVHYAFNTLRPRQNGCNFTDDILKCIFFNENVWVSIKGFFLLVKLTLLQYWLRQWRHWGDTHRLRQRILRPNGDLR